MSNIDDDQKAAREYAYELACEASETMTQATPRELYALAFLAGAARERGQEVLRDGGEGIGQVYSPTNCSECHQLTPDYYFIGKGHLCTECFEKFPAGPARANHLKTCGLCYEGKPCNFAECPDDKHAREDLEQHAYAFFQNRACCNTILEKDLQALFELLARIRQSSERLGYEKGIEAASQLCDQEQVRQIKSDWFQSLNGQDTARALGESVRALTRPRRAVGAREEGK